MKQKRLKSAAEKLITKPVTMRPAAIERIEQCAKNEDRTFSQMARILIEEALQLRAPVPGGFVAAVFDEIEENQSQPVPSSHG